jgi:fructose-bisphosphate aldolase class 1
VYKLLVRCQEYKKLGCQFAKWRMVINIGEDIPTPEAIAEVSWSDVGILLIRYFVNCV